MRGAFAGWLGFGFEFWFRGLGRIGWVVFLMRAEANDGTALMLVSLGCAILGIRGRCETHYGSEHRGHLYFPSSFSHMPHSFGLGFSGASSTSGPSAGVSWTAALGAPSAPSATSWPGAGSVAATRS